MRARNANYFGRYQIDTLYRSGFGRRLYLRHLDLRPFLSRLGLELEVHMIKINGLRGRERWIPDPFPPPQTIREPEIRSLAGPFFFLVQRGLAEQSDFRRPAFWPKSVSARPASLSIRPSCKSRRIQKLTYFPVLVRNGLRRS